MDDEGNGRAGRARVPTRPPWGVLEGFGVFLAWMAALYLVAGALGAGRAPAHQMAAGQAGTDLSLQMLTVVVGGGFILIIAGVFLQSRAPAGEAGFRQVGLVRPGPGALRRAVLPIILGVVAYVGVDHGWDQVLRMLGVDLTQVPKQELVVMVARSRSVEALVLTFLGASVAAPMVEEVVFRGMLYLPLRRSMGVVPAAVLVGLLFGLVHGYVWGLPEFFVLSCVFVALFERTGTLFSSMVAHSAYNTFQLVVLLIVRTGAAGQ